MEIYAVNTSGIGEAVVRKFIHLLPLSRQNEIFQYRNLTDRVHSLIGELLIRTFVTHKLGILNEAVVLLRDKYGKPYLEKHPDFHFNVSHSGAWVMGAFDANPIGIDIEWMVPIDLSIADFIFTDFERENLKNYPPASRLSHFYSLWTLKESYVKAMGMGLSIPANSFSISIKCGQIQLQSETLDTLWHFKQYSLDTDYALAVCSKSHKPSKHLYVICWERLLRNFSLTISKASGFDISEPSIRRMPQ